jgi:hypothetical protein
MVRILCLVALLGPLVAGAAVAGEQARFGVVTQRGTEPPCATFDGPALPRGTRVRIEATEPQRSLVGRIGEQRSACHAAALVTGTSYAVLVPPEAGGVLLAPAVVMNEAGDATTLQMCASSEGIHLTAWREGARIWHVYHYLGYDIEPTCAAGEFKD